MPSAYGRDLDLNLLRVFVVVAETGRLTATASRLYLTQPAVSAALPCRNTGCSERRMVRKEVPYD